MKTLIINRMLAWILGLAACVQVGLFAQGTLIVPSELANSQGNYASDIGSSSFQQIYAGREFTAVAGDMIQITGLAFRIDENWPAQSVIIPSIAVELSTNSRQMSEMTSNTEANNGADEQTVFSCERQNEIGFLAAI